MDYQRLKQAEADFLHAYPGGFADPGLEQVLKRHRMDKMETFAKEVFAKPRFNQPHGFLDDLVKLVSRSSMVSMFEKPKFRDLVADLNSDDKEILTEAFRKLVHGGVRSQRQGFEDVVEFLAARKLAKWSIITIGLIYYRPQKEVFVKPTTAKKIVASLDLGLEYKPRPTWAFYKGYRDAIAEIKANVDPSLASNNAALTGFLMTVL